MTCYDKVSTAVGLAWFTRVSPVFSVVNDDPCNTDTSLSRQADACLVTILLDWCTPMHIVVSHKENGRPICRPGNAKTDTWQPVFWRNDGIQHALRVLLRDVTNPVIWVMGQYLRTQFDILVREGLIPRRVMSAIGDQDCASLMYRAKVLEKIILPDEQGFGHFRGARLAVFSEAEEPTELYEYWLEHAELGDNRILDQLVLSDEQMLSSALAWISPFGEEDREHAKMTRRDIPAASLAQMLADELELPLLPSSCSEEEFAQWECHHVLPLDLVQLMKEVP